MPSTRNPSNEQPAEVTCPCPTGDMFLDRLPTGAHATIVCVNCPAHMRKRLAEMGILPGVTVQMKRTAPFGDPIAFQVRGYQLSLRRSDAEKISVRQLPDAVQAAPGVEVTK